MDGADGAACPINNLANTPIESIETEQPLMIEQFGLVPDTGGAGKYRGGLAMVRDFRVLADNAIFQLRSDRHDFLPWGMDGGKPGTPVRNILNPETENREIIPGKNMMTVNKGDMYSLTMAGAGGYGDPLERDVYAVLDDVLQEKLTVDYVRREYGVAVDPESLELEIKATEELRSVMRADKG
jgi:N-methylhydantoinase B